MERAASAIADLERRSGMAEPKMPPWRLVLQRPSITGESPVWCERTARLYWVDVQQPALHRLDPQTGINESWIMPAWIGCLALGGGAADGSVLVGLRTGAYRFELATGALSLIAPAPYDPRWRGAWIGTSKFSGLESVKNAFGVRIGIVHTATNTI